MKYLFPTILGSVAILLSAFVDGILASAFCGTDAFSAVNLAEPVILFMQAVFFIFGIGGAVSISVAKGRREHQRANSLFSLAFFMGIVVAVIVGVLGILLLDPIVSVLCNNAELVPLVRAYTLVTFCGAPLMIFVPMMTYIIRADGMPKLSANILLVANILNLCMDVVYMKVFHMGVGGAALATVTGYVLGLILVIVYLKSPKRTLKLHFPKKEDWKELKTLCTGGLASVVNTILLFVKAILINRIVLSTGGVDAMAVFSVCNFTVTFASMFMGGGSDTMTPILGLLYGEKDQRGMDYIVRKTMLVVLISCGILVAFMMAFPQLVLELFGVRTSARLAIGIPAIRIFSVSLLGIAFSYTLMNYFQTVSQKTISVLITVLRGIVITVPSAYLCSRFMGVSGIWWAFVIAEALTIVVTLIVCRIKASRSNGKFKGVLLKEQYDSEVSFDLTLKAQRQSASDVSELVEDFCLKNGESEKTSNFAGVLAEEMVENIRRYNNGEAKEPDIDLICRLRDEDLILTVRDNGKTLSSVEPDKDNEEFENLRMIHSLAKDVDYTRTLGLNSTVVTLEGSRKG